MLLGGWVSCGGVLVVPVMATGLLSATVSDGENSLRSIQIVGVEDVLKGLEKNQGKDGLYNPGAMIDAMLETTCEVEEIVDSILEMDEDMMSVDAESPQESQDLSGLVIDSTFVANDGEWICSRMGATSEMEDEDDEDDRVSCSGHIEI